MLLVIVFRGTIAEVVANNLKVDEKIIINSSDMGIKSALQRIDELKPARILGMGMYSGRATDMLRLEQKCSSRFRNSGTNTKVHIKSWLSGSRGIKHASGMGNSWCNKLSWEITNSFPGIPYSFLHIPSSFSPIEASEYIQDAIT